MSTKDDGGPAFPTGTQVEQNNATGETTIHQYLSDGISVRDYFAAKAMQAWLSGFGDDSRHPSDCGTESLLATQAYKVADAMLKARKA